MLDSHIIVNLVYLVAAVLFILGLKMMAHPRSAVRGNLISSVAMLVAVIATTWSIFAAGDATWAGWLLIALGIIIGSGIGIFLAIKVEMTQMPQLVALFNGLGGGASVFVASAELLGLSDAEATADVMLAIGVSGLIGTVTFWGSLVAFGKLQEIDIFEKPLPIPAPQAFNAVLAVVLVILVAVMTTTGFGWPFIFVFLCATALGLTLVMPIGGADMPVVIALLNSYSGLAAAATGFVIDNNVLTISGSLVGASGIILTQIMCKAMNRSLVNVLFGTMQASSGPVGADDELYATVRSTSAEDIAMILDTAQRVVFVPGYGLAVAQAQHAVRDLANLLKEKGTAVEYAIHPVAGRMPGHMNVLLAEADVPYEQLKEMDEINPTLAQVDVAIVIGANDVVNPLANTDPNSPIAGMPIIEVDKARTVIVIKRSLSPGFAKIPNPLFAAENALMFFSDGKKAILDIVSAVKEL